MCVRGGGFVPVVGGTVFCEQLRRAIALVVGMRQAEVDEERTLVIFCFPFAKLFEHTLGMPGAAGFRGAAAFGGVSGAGEDCADGVFL